MSGDTKLLNFLMQPFVAREIYQANFRPESSRPHLRRQLDLSEENAGVTLGRRQIV
jgi:hypothetical protein